MSQSSRIVIAAIACVLGLAAVPAEAVVITRLVSVEYSGAFAPEGPAPWLAIRLDDGGSSGTVTLTFEAPNLVGSEFVSTLYLNVKDIAPTSLSFLNPVKTGSFDTPTVSLGANQFKAAGNSAFDILLSFAMGGGASKRFGGGDVLSYTITGPASLTAAFFDVLSESAGKPGFSVVAHVQGIGANGANSGWVTVPDPSSLSLLGLSAIGMLRRRRR